MGARRDQWICRPRSPVSPLLQYWPFEVLGRKPNMEEDDVEVTSHSWNSVARSEMIFT